MNVLFVCSGNAFRSPVAEALFKKLRPGLDGDSAGTNPATQISKSAREYLEREQAVDCLKRLPEGLNGKDLEAYDLIVALESSHRKAVLKVCPECRDKVVIWNIEDPYFLPPEYNEKIFEEIKKKVIELVNSI